LIVKIKIKIPSQRKIKEDRYKVQDWKI